MIDIEQFSRVELRVATVSEAERVAGSHKLVRLTVDLGDEHRVVVAGIAKQYEAEELVGRQVVVVTNLEPARLMGIESRGMVLAAAGDGPPVLLQPDRPVADGTPVR